jgi:hypothetical protein
MSRIHRAFPAIVLLTVTFVIQADESDQALTAMTINDLMVNVVTPATDTLWGIEDPQTDAEWQVFVDAANTVIDAGNAIKAGGTGPSDDEWAANAEWQAFADRLIAAATDARQAAREKDLEAMWSAGDVMYPPCEECHLQFHPDL